LVESVINNLSVPAFFFERILEDGVEKNDVIDGQQRLTTLRDFFENRLRLVGSQDAVRWPPSVGRPGGGMKLGPVAVKPPVATHAQRPRRPRRA